MLLPLLVNIPARSLRCTLLRRTPLTPTSFMDSSYRDSSFRDSSFRDSRDPFFCAANHGALSISEQRALSALEQRVVDQV